MVSAEEARSKAERDRRARYHRGQAREAGEAGWCPLPNLEKKFEEELETEITSKEGKLLLLEWDPES